MLASYAPGDILRERDITKEIVPGLDSSVIASAYQLAYKTRKASGEADVTVTSVYKPKQPLSPPRVLGITMFEDAAALDCANSFGLLKNTNSNHTLVALSQVAMFNAALHKVRPQLFTRLQHSPDLMLRSTGLLRHCSRL